MVGGECGEREAGEEREAFSAPHSVELRADSRCSVYAFLRAGLVDLSRNCVWSVVGYLVSKSELR